MTSDPAPPVPAEYGAIRPGVDQAPPQPLLRRRGGSGRRRGPEEGGDVEDPTEAVSEQAAAEEADRGEAAAPPPAGEAAPSPPPASSSPRPAGGPGAGVGDRRGGRSAGAPPPFEGPLGVPITTTQAAVGPATRMALGAPVGGTTSTVARPAPVDYDHTEEVASGHRWGKQRVRVVRGRRSRRIIRRIDTWTVLKVSFVFYLCVLGMIIIAGVILWNLAAAFGLIHSIDKSVRSLFAYKTYQLHPMAVLKYTVAAGAGLTIIGTAFNVLAAAVYNLISDVIGGIQLVVVADDGE